MSLHQRRVVITGIGMITPLGVSTPQTWRCLISGQSGIKKLPESFVLDDYPVRIGGMVTGEQELLDGIIAPKLHSRMDRFIHLALIAGDEAMKDAGLTQELPANRDRFGVYMGVGMGGLQSVVDAVHEVDQRGLKRLSPFTIPKVISNLAPGWLSMQWNLQGPITVFTNACASSTDSVGMAFRSIRDGYVDYMLAGGTESCLTTLALGGFGNMRALAMWDGDPAAASRPFEKNRKGFVLAEGATVLVLESADSAYARGAQVYAEVIGYGASAEAYHVTAMHPDGLGAVRAMEHALADARIDKSLISYINAHGTGTPMNDAIETCALKKVFGASLDPVRQGHAWVSSTKSMTGHLLGAAGATEVAFTALALHHELIPPTINLDEPDPLCDLDYVSHVARERRVEYALSNSFGFGRGNAVVALKKA